MERAVDVPGDGLREFFSQPGDPVARPHFAERIADDEKTARSDPLRQMPEQGGLSRWREIMEDVEERDVAAEIGELRFDVVKAQLDIAITARRDRRAVIDLARVAVESKNRLSAGALAQIKAEQPHPAADVKDWLGGAA